MRTLIIPCGGKSSRFPNMKPKYLLTHPDGSLMVEKSISGLPLSDFDRIIVTIIKEHSEKYEAALILKQVFGDTVEICILDSFTRCQSETVYLTIKKMDVVGSIVVKDSDNYAEAILDADDFIVGMNITTLDKDVNRLSSKSFLIVNDQNIVTDIVEKRIKSEYICIGVYGFSDSSLFCKVYELLQEKHDFAFAEIYVSHIVSYLIGANNVPFRYIECNQFEDWGTIEDWEIVQKKMQTYFIDFDGTIAKNTGRYGSNNWEDPPSLIPGTIELLKKLFDEGAQIVITTSRPKEYCAAIEQIFEDNGITLHAIVSGCNHSKRVIINDFAPTNKYPSCEAISLPRNGSLSMYLR